MIHNLSLVDPEVYVPASSKVWQFATICSGTTIGMNSVIGSCCWIGKNCTIGNGVHLNHGCFIPHGTVLEDDVFLGPGVIFTDDKHPKANNPNYEALPPIIRKGASIGAGAVILPGVEVGSGAVIGAGAVVTRWVDPDKTVTGVPAKKLKPSAKFGEVPSLHAFTFHE